jgi:phosphoribosylglycinamide formyltransferase-1
MRPPVRSSSASPGPAASGRPARLAVLLSGRGSNYGAIQEAILRGEVPATIELVLSDVEDAPGLEKARRFGVPAIAVPRLRGEGRSAHEQRLRAALEEASIDWICLAGFMRVLSPELVERYRERILNVHPSLLPAFPGRDAQRQALEHGVRVSGCTVHFVDAGVDSGPIVVQRAVPVLDRDTPEALAGRILEQEHRAFPEALRRLLTEPWRLCGRRVLFGVGAGAGEDGQAAYP